MGTLWKDHVDRFERLLNALDPELAAHCGRAGAIATEIASFMGLSTERIDLLDTGARLHDIGKIFISRAILDKPGPLDDAEWSELRRHPLMGYELVRDEVQDRIAEIVLTHHERFDGTGYPRGLAGHATPIEARILQAADAIDAITTERPYQPALPLRYALNELIRCAGSQFDPVVVEAVVELDQRDNWETISDPIAV
jgi:HD-GYP domain-containing protein (c-di-GMP phosphodiesterase class II)